MAATKIAADTPSEAREPAARESWTAFAAWAAEELGCRLHFEDGRYRLEAGPHDDAQPEATESGLLRRSWLKRRRRAESEEAESPEPFATESPEELASELVERLGQSDPPNAKPAEQPEAVHELTERLFAAYKLDNGKAHVAGCLFEDRPVVRLTRVFESETADRPLVEHAYFDELGVGVGSDELTRLGLDRVAPLRDGAPRIDAGRRERMLESARKSAEQAVADEGASLGRLETIVWVKWASGSLRFEFGEEAVDTHFEGWARTLDPPPVVCPLTGRKTYHLATVEGGGIAAAEEIAECAESGRRHVRSDLKPCSVTRQLVEPGLLAECSVTGEDVLQKRLRQCPKCGQSVSPRVLSPHECRGCSKTQRVASEDPRLASIVAKHPGLLGTGEPSSRWTLGETRAAYILERTGWFRRWIVTLDKQSLAVLRKAEASRFSSTWRLV